MKVLLASGYGSAAVSIAGVDMLPKPYTLDSLRAALAALGAAPG